MSIAVHRGRHEKENTGVPLPLHIVGMKDCAKISSRTARALSTWSRTAFNEAHCAVSTSCSTGIESQNMSQRVKFKDYGLAKRPLEDRVDT